MREPWRIPASWRWTTLGEVTSVVGGGTPKTSRGEYWNGDIPWITPADLSGYERKEIRSGERYITAAGLRGSSAHLLPTGTVLFSSRAPIGYVAIAATPMATNQGFKSFVPPSGIDPSFLYYYLRSAKGLALSAASGTTFKELSKRRAALLVFPLAPVPEQHRIVARVDALFAGLNDGIAALERSETNLERYRASVLKAAVEGRLTERWRSENPPDQTGEQLLRRILDERRKRWEEEQLAAFAAKGRKPPRNWKTSYKEPLAADTADLPSLPEGWCWATMDQVTSRTMNGFGRRSDTPGGEPRMVLRLADVKNGRISYSKPRYLDCTPAQIAKYKVGAADVLIIRVNGSANLVGRLVGCEDTPQDVLFCDHFIRAKCVNQELGRWLRTYSDSEGFRSKITRTKVSSAGQHTVNQGSILAIPVPIPPERERVEVRKALGAGLSKTESAEESTAKASRLVSVLRQSILKRAFEGRLVPQDSNDEPAGVLLKRIRAAREA
ncbi:MAG: hypothetical protein F4210_07050 [Holophagales bacterium]|nr:hypothetical protein [Holophagales bacterium]MYF95252.1 hypothetical protein [Holophagales bacterium]